MPRLHLPLLLAALACLLPSVIPVGRAATPAAAGKDEKKYVAYRISRGDRLTVAVLGEPDLRVGGARVEAIGTVNLPLIQNIPILNLTLLEAEAAIAKAYREGRFLRNPQVTVTVEEYAPRIVSISGKVNMPGRHEIPADVEFTIKDLIFKAGGFTDTARSSAVKVTRTRPDGTSQTFTLDVESGIKGRDTSASKDANFILEPDDVVYVSEKII